MSSASRNWGASITIAAALVVPAAAGAQEPMLGEPKLEDRATPSTGQKQVAPPDPKAEGAVVKTVAQKEGGKVVVPISPLTPVVPEPSKEPRRAYQLYWQIDGPVLAASGVLAFGRFIKQSEASAPPYCTTLPEGCSRDDLSAIDRPFAGRYSPAWGRASDVGMYALLAAPIPVLAFDEGIWNALNDSVVIYESVLLATALGGLGTLSANRARPFVYGNAAPLKTRESPDAALSFISGHSTACFALSTALFWTVERRHGFDAFSGAVLGVGTATSAFVSVSRVAAGKHFPTDVLAGALLGASVGTLMPFLHTTPVVVMADADETQAQVSVGRMF